VHSIGISFFKYPSVASLDDWLIDDSLHPQVYIIFVQLKLYIQLKWNL